MMMVMMMLFSFVVLFLCLFVCSFAVHREPEDALPTRPTRRYWDVKQPINENTILSLDA